MSSRLVAGLAGFVLAVALAPSARGQPVAARRAAVALRFAVAYDEGAAVADEAWLSERVTWANRIFAPAEVSFRATRSDRLEDGHLHIESRRDRHVLGRFVERGFINVFVVGSLADVDVPGRMLRGVHWRSRVFAGTHYVILSRIAGPAVLAHELGHFYGNPHSATPGNIMSYDRGGVALPFLDAAQLRRVARSSRRFLRTHELSPAR